MANYDSIKKKTDEQAKVKIEESNKIYDDQYAATEKIYNEQIKQSDASFARAYDRANVQRIVNERYAKEIAANMGLSNSGYNLTQQTQIMLSYGNAVLETDMQKTAAANSIRQQLAGVKADIEAKKSQSAFDIQTSYDQQAVDTYNQQVAAEEAAAAAREAALKSAKTQQQNAYNSLKSILVSSEYSAKQKALEINSYCSTYGVSASEFLSYIGMSDSAYLSYIGLGTQNSSLGIGQNYNYGAPDEIKYGYTYDYGTLIPGRNGWSVSYKDGTTRPATAEEVKAGKGLTPKKIVNKSTTKSNTSEKGNDLKATTWDYSKYSFK